MSNPPSELKGIRATVMGLGLHGGGLASARFLARRGARVTVTDNRQDPSVFAAVLPELEALGVRTVLGRHEERDFREAQLVVKNPAVPQSSRFLAVAREHDVPVETDVSLFLRLCASPILGVTGSKGKSTTAAALIASSRATPLPPSRSQAPSRLAGSSRSENQRMRARVPSGKRACQGSSWLSTATCSGLCPSNSTALSAT